MLTALHILPAFASGVQAFFATTSRGPTPPPPKKTRTWAEGQCRSWPLYTRGLCDFTTAPDVFLNSATCDVLIEQTFVFKTLQGPSEESDTMVRREAVIADKLKYLFGAISLSASSLEAIVPSSLIPRRRRPQFRECACPRGDKQVKMSSVCNHETRGLGMKL